MAKLNTESLDTILNDCLNKAMCRKGRIQNPNSNNIAEFVTNYINETNLSVVVDEYTGARQSNIPDVSFNEERVAVCYNRGCVDQLNGNCHRTRERYDGCKSKQTES